MTKKILITGGTGFIGFHLAKKCLKLGWVVTSLSSKKPKKIRKLNKVKYIIADISKRNKLKKVINDKYDYVVNLAGYVDHSNKNKTVKSHYIGCKNIASIFIKSKIQKFIQIGSSIEYGRISSPHSEENYSKRKINSFYGESKLLSSIHLMNLYKEYNFPVIILRLYLVYGPNQDPNRVIPFTILKSIFKKEFNCSNGKQFRDFLYIDDLIEAVIRSLKHKNLFGEIINIGQGKPIIIRELILRISKIIGTGKPVFGKIKLRKDEMIKLYPKINKIKKLLKWKPKINLDQGLHKTINYYKKNKFEFLKFIK